MKERRDTPTLEIRGRQRNGRQQGERHIQVWLEAQLITKRNLEVKSAKDTRVCDECCGQRRVAHGLQGRISVEHMVCDAYRGQRILIAASDVA